MKYRRLDADELAELEQEFIQFLAANTITGSEWEKIKQETPAKAEQLIELFSDLVFDKTLSNIRYLEFKTSRDIKTFHCLPDKMILNGLRILGDTSLDFTQESDPQQMLQLLQLSGARLQLYTAEKTYTASREQELFELMEKGALISRDGALFKALEAAKG